jgi:hypothetical protein
MRRLMFGLAGSLAFSLLPLAPGECCTQSTHDCGDDPCSCGSGSRGCYDSAADDAGKSKNTPNHLTTAKIPEVGLREVSLNRQGLSIHVVSMIL